MKHALVTGGGRGIGLATAHLLLEAGHHVTICGRDAARLDAARAQFPALRALPADLTLAEHRAQLARHTGPVDILINNVGGSLGGARFTDAPVDHWRHVMELNFFSALHLSQLFTPHMAEQGWGRVVHIASIWGKERGGGAAYNAAKAALISLGKSMAVDLAASGIRVNTVAPGSTIFPGGGWDQRKQKDPEGIEAFEQSLPLARFGEPEEVARVVAFLCSDQASFVNGACWVVDGGQSFSV